MTIRMNMLIATLAGGYIAAPLSAAEVIATFTTTVSFVNPAAPGFPPSLGSVTVGTAVSGSIRYDAASPAVANGFPAPWSLATRYQPPGMTINLTIGSVTMNSWSGPFTAFVWNNDAISGPIVDGLVYLNLAPANSTIVQIGNLGLNSATFSNESLPARTVNGGFLCELFASASSSAFLRTNSWTNLAFAPVPLCPADVTGNGVVNIDDLVLIITNWGATSGPADVTHDNVVNIDDLVTVITAWGTCP